MGRISTSPVLIRIYILVRIFIWCVFYGLDLGISYNRYLS